MLSQSIINTMIVLSLKTPYKSVTRQMIANKLKIARSLTNYYFKTRKDLEDAMIQCAIKRKILPILAHAAIYGVSIPKSLKKKALRYYA